MKKKLTKDSEMHKTENTRIMMENVALIKEINELRRECKLLKVSRRNQLHEVQLHCGVSVVDQNTYCLTMRSHTKRLRSRDKSASCSR